MSQEHGFFGADNIPYFNGGLFSDNSTIELDHADMGILHSASQHDWSHIEPAIFGTLFERSLDEAKRSMIGAHYTSTEDILLLIEPVIMDPLRRRWHTVQQTVLNALTEEEATAKVGRPSPRFQLQRPALILLQDWAVEITRVRILDPACGSGNFLYVALKRLLDLWHEARLFGLAHGLTLALDPIPHPGQLFGIEVDFYAHEIASIVVWIGFLQWKHDHGVKDDKEPLLKVLTNIEHADAILRHKPEDKPDEPSWPEADFIIGNPPFLGGTEIRKNLGDDYAENLIALYKGRLPARTNLVTYWFEKARAQIKAKKASRAGLIATQAIRQGVSRISLDRVKADGDIFFAWSDRPWVLEGAAVRISMVGFDDGRQTDRTLNGVKSNSISSRLRSDEEETRPKKLLENKNLAFQGVILVGDFELDSDVAIRMLNVVSNPNGRTNQDVVRRLASGDDLTKRNRDKYLIDFSACATESEAALYEMPFEYVKEKVKTVRATSRSGDRTGVSWWRLQRSRPKLRAALRGLTRYAATPRVSKHRIFDWLDVEIIPDTRLFIFARDDDYFFGVLQSRAHEVWSLSNASMHGDGKEGGRPTYTTDACFQNFSFPWPPGTEPAESEDPRVKAIADAARELIRLRYTWLNPSNVSREDLKKITLTNLYNKRPTWLENAHRTLDEAVFAAYNWPPDLSDQKILSNLLALNQERAASQPPKSISSKSKASSNSSKTPKQKPPSASSS